MVLVLVLSFLPGILWLVWFTRADRARPEPKRLVALVFFLGMLATLAAGLLNDRLAGALGLRHDRLRDLFLLFFLIVGPVEETLKLLVVRATIYRHREFDEPIDAFVYAAAAALGFASLENLSYGAELGTGVLVMRAVLSVPGHVLFSALWAYGLAHRRFGKGSVLPWLALAALSHGLYDFLVIGGGLVGGAVGVSAQLGQILTFVLGVVPLVAVLWLVLARLIKQLQLQSAAAAATAPAPAAAAAAPSVRGPRRSVLLTVVGGGTRQVAQ